MKGPLIINSFEKDGVIYPPTYEECANCIYNLARLSFSFMGEELDYVCEPRRNFVEADGWCPGHLLNYMLIDDEVIDAIEEAERRGTLPYDHDLTEEELEEFKAECA